MLISSIDDFIKPHSNYPKKIQDALLVVQSHPGLNILTRAQRETLKWLVIRSDKSDATKPVLARLDVIASQAQISYKTVQRAIQRFFALGILASKTAKRGRFGSFASNSYQFTNEFSALINLCPNRHGIKNKEQPDLDFFNAITEAQSNASGRAHSDKPLDFPNELKELEKFEINGIGICRLRKLAHHRNYKLEDIWTVAKARIQNLKLTGGRLYNYLKSMILKDSDYQARAEQELRLENQTTEKVEFARNQVIKSIQIAEDLLKEKIRHLPIGRKENMALLKTLLRTPQEKTKPKKDKNVRPLYKNDVYLKNKDH